MSVLLAKIITQAEKTFSYVNKDGFMQQINQLKRLVDGMTFADLKLGRDCISSDTFASRVRDF